MDSTIIYSLPPRSMITCIILTQDTLKENASQNSACIGICISQLMYPSLAYLFPVLLDEVTRYRSLIRYMKVCTDSVERVYHGDNQDHAQVMNGHNNYLDKQNTKLPTSSRK